MIGDSPPLSVLTTTSLVILIAAQLDFLHHADALPPSADPFVLQLEPASHPPVAPLPSATTSLRHGGGGGGGGSSSSSSSTIFDINVDWASGNEASTLPTTAFGIRKMQVIFYPRDGRTYGYADIVNYTDKFYPVSYSSEVGVFSSADGFTNWSYHGIAVCRGPAGSWDTYGIASPGVAVAADGTVLIGYSGEHFSEGGRNRGIFVASSSHPLGPFTQHLQQPVASPEHMCGGTGRCDDVVMQSQGGLVHLYYAVKDSDRPASCPVNHCIRHTTSSDGGTSWSPSRIVLSRRGTMETFAGQWFPSLLGGRGAMILITDNAAKQNAHLPCYISDGGMSTFVPCAPDTLQAHPPTDPSKIVRGNWAPEYGRGQLAFIPGPDGQVQGVSFAQWSGNIVRTSGFEWQGYSHTVYRMRLTG